MLFFTSESLLHPGGDGGAIPDELGWGPDEIVEFGTDLTTSMTLLANHEYVDDEDIVPYAMSCSKSILRLVEDLGGN